MINGWNIFPYMAIASLIFAIVGAIFALRTKSRSTLALCSTAMAILVYGAFIATLWISLERPPLRTMGETRLWYSFFMLVAGFITYLRWNYRWILSFSTLMATVFVVINILKPEIHDQSLMPALQSVWFVPHVAVYMFSYALLGCATLLAIAALIRRNEELDMPIARLLYGGITFFTIGIILFCIKGFDDFVLQPTIYSERVKAHPLEVFLVILIAGNVAGITGMLLAIPSYTVLRVLAKEFFSEFALVQKLTQNI